MKFFSANLQNLRELYIKSLQRALDMEESLSTMLRTMAETATDEELKETFRLQLSETKRQAVRLEDILTRTPDPTATTSSKPLAALRSEAEEMIKDAKNENVRDAALIAAAQEVQHHQIAVYGTLRHWARILGEERDAEQLDVSIEQERSADLILTQIASRVNTYADKDDNQAA
ncbi:MAG TPA: DUF892 family protein [Acidobacteriaceae bacterium]|nr:DUF892 family protein [Acidobacteriaceae bacterium]